MNRKNRRGRDEGSIYQRGDGRWAGAVTLGYEGGKRKRKSLYGLTRKEVQEKLTKVLRDQQQELPIPDERQTVGQFLEDWLENTVKQTVRPRTLTSYRYLVRYHMVPVLGKVPLAKLTPQQVQRFLNEKAEVLAPRTVQYIRSVLRRALGQALKFGLVGRNVAGLTKGPRVERRGVEPFTPDDVSVLLRGLQEERLGILYLVALTLGLRQGEALGLRWTDVNLAAKQLVVNGALQRVDGELRIVEPKTAQSRRTLSLSLRLVDALRTHRRRQAEDKLLAGSKWQECGLVFTTRMGRPLDGTNVTRDFQRMLARLELPRKRFHDLRHTAASLLLSENVHPRVVMDQLGHSEIRVTMDTYSHVAPALRQDAAAQVETALVNAEAGAKK